MTVDARTFRDALARFASGVCVLTAADGDGRPVGVTVSAFSAVSLDPPLVLFCIGNQSANLTTWLTATRFSVNVLSAAQVDLSVAFASTREDKFVHAEGTMGSNGCFRLAGALVILDCRRTTVHPAGDHFIVVGEVEAVRRGVDADPLLHFRGRYRTLAPNSG